jgi:hypothetical protein
MVTPDGFAWNGETFDSLSEIAFAITGTKWNGPRFFGLRDSRPQINAGEPESSHKNWQGPLRDLYERFDLLRHSEPGGEPKDVPAAPSSYLTRGDKQ